MYKGQKAVLTEKESGYKEFGKYIMTTSDNHIIETETGSAKLYLIKNWECEEDKA